MWSHDWVKASGMWREALDTICKPGPGKPQCLILFVLPMFATEWKGHWGGWSQKDDRSWVSDSSQGSFPLTSCSLLDNEPEKKSYCVKLLRCGGWFTAAGLSPLIQVGNKEGSFCLFLYLFLFWKMSRSGNRLGHEYSRSHAKKAMTFTDSEASGGFGVRNPF